MRPPEIVSNIGGHSIVFIDPSDSNDFEQKLRTLGSKLLCVKSDLSQAGFDRYLNDVLLEMSLPVPGSYGYVLDLCIGAVDNFDAFGSIVMVNKNRHAPVLELIEFFGICSPVWAKYGKPARLVIVN